MLPIIQNDCEIDNKKDKLDELGVEYKTTAVAKEGDLTPCDIYSNCYFNSSVQRECD